ncbi:unnamed protein product [Lathyrus sativus]|nr:unnamed protein product [Lathyrus sativus]
MSNPKLIHDNNLKSSMLMFHQDKEDGENEEQNIVLLSKPTSSREKHKMEDKEEEENDGFKTPTRVENRIQEPKQCPLAPRKSKPSLKRRKPHCRQLLDVSREVELLFQIKHKTFSSSQQSTKKVRRE